jgi:hypothetical protein
MGKERHNGNDFPAYYLHYESTVDLLVKYFLPGFDKVIVDGRVLTQTTLGTNSLFLCPATTAVDDYIFNLLPIFYLGIIRYFVLRNSPGKESWVREIRDGMAKKFSQPDGSQGSTHSRRRRREPNIKDLSVMTCTLVGEAYGTINMYEQCHEMEPPEWRRLSSKAAIGHLFSSLYDFTVGMAHYDGFITEEKILAIF